MSASAPATRAGGRSRDRCGEAGGALAPGCGAAADDGTGVGGSPGWRGKGGEARASVLAGERQVGCAAVVREALSPGVRVLGFLGEAGVSHPRSPGCWEGGVTGQASSCPRTRGAGPLGGAGGPQGEWVGERANWLPGSTLLSPPVERP